MKTRFISLTAGMIVGAVIFLVGICIAGLLDTKSLVIALLGFGLMGGCGAELEFFKTKHHLTTHASIKKLLKG